MVPEPVRDIRNVRKADKRREKSCRGTFFPPIPHVFSVPDVMSSVTRMMHLDNFQES